MNIDIKQTTQSAYEVFDETNFQFGSTMTDHVFLADYKEGAWQNARIVPFGDVYIGLSSTVLHYGQSVFEGMKAYKRASGDIVLLRPEENAKRIQVSAARLAIPELPKDIFLEGLFALLKLDKKWVPSMENGSLYVRPFIFGADEMLGVKPSDTYTFAIIMAPAGEYYPKPLSVKVETNFTRACPGGTGFSKAAGNYAASYLPTKQAQAEGFDQLIWTDAIQHTYIEESGTMNLFFIHKNGNLITPQPNDTILKGITRDTIMQLAKQKGLEVEDRAVSVDEVVKGIVSGDIVEVFGVGTAVNISYIHSVSYNGKVYELSKENPVGSEFKLLLEGLRNGEVEDMAGWITILE